MFLTPYETFGKGIFMTLRHFRIFIEVASAGSITQAARNLYLTQPTVSTAVRELEEHYGTLFFDRINQRLRITGEGRRFLDYARHFTRASDARRPRHAPLQTGRRPVCLTLRALTRVRHEKGGRNPLERSLACMVPEARLELARCCQRWILSPLRLPIPPLGHVMRELVYHSFLPISPKMELRAFR